MKKYTFTIEVEDHKSNGSFIDSLIDEVTDEKRQQALTHKINAETTKQHRKILCDFADEVNKELQKVDLCFDVLAYDDYISNNYQRSMIKMEVGNISWIIGIEGHNDRNFKDSKYITFTGDYELRIGSNDTRSYTANNQWSRLYQILTKGNELAKVLDAIRGSVKNHIAKEIVH